MASDLYDRCQIVCRSGRNTHCFLCASTRDRTDVTSARRAAHRHPAVQQRECSRLLSVAPCFPPERNRESLESWYIRRESWFFHTYVHNESILDFLAVGQASMRPQSWNGAQRRMIGAMPESKEGWSVAPEAFTSAKENLNTRKKRRGRQRTSFLLTRRKRCPNQKSIRARQRSRRNGTPSSTADGSLRAGQKAHVRRRPVTRSAGLCVALSRSAEETPTFCISEAACSGDCLRYSRRRDSKKPGTEQIMGIQRLLQALGYVRSQQHWITLEAADPHLAFHSRLAQRAGEGARVVGSYVYQTGLQNRLTPPKPAVFVAYAAHDEQARDASESLESGRLPISSRHTTWIIMSLYRI